MLDVPDRVELVEVLPRDGLQRVDGFLPTEEKVAFIENIVETGVSTVEVTGFAHPDAVPNLRDAEAVLDGLDGSPDVTYRALVPNAVGMERAVAAEVDAVNALVTVSETYSRRNQGMSPDETLAELATIVEMGADAGVPVDAGVATSFYCPYDGRIDQGQTSRVVEAAIDRGVDGVTLAATVGMADPAQVDGVLAATREAHPDVDVGLHLHDTNGMALANALVGLQHGVARLDASLAGIGGGTVFPEALGSVGNVPTEDLLQLLDRLGVDTGVEFDAVAELAGRVRDRLGVGESHVLRGGTVPHVLSTTE